MLNNRTIRTLLFCFFLWVSTNSTFASYRENSVHRIGSEISQKPDELHPGAYLIIGVFEREKNARQLEKKALEDGLEVHYSLRAVNGFYYVYTFSDSSKNNVIGAYYALRSVDQYKDAWILTVQDLASNLGTDNLIKQEGQEITMNSAAKNPIETIADVPSEIVVMNFQVVNMDGGEPVKADIQLVDGERAKMIDHIESGTDWALHKESLGLDTLQLIAQAMGYQKTQVELNIHDLKNSSENTTSYVKHDTIFVKIELKELEKGDVQIMFNTYFYGNSTVMRVQSKYELEEVYKILERNPGMRIKLHGHTNGFSRGKSYLYLDEKKNFFELVRTKEYQKKGLSSTKLSAYRAETIKSYLVNRGIASDRLETVGWGGEKMIYDSDSPMAKNNIRVEIEILDK